MTAGWVGALLLSCFNFSRPIVEPLGPEVPPSIDGRDVHVFGTRPDGVDWAAGRATLDLPIGTVYQRILEHESLKDMRKTTLVRTAEERPGYLAFQFVDVAVRVRAILFKMKVTWREAWGFVVAKGSAEAPERIVASYEKVAGTKHINHQCGSYIMDAKGGSTTELSFYEEIKAARRSAEDTRNMHAGILKNLRRR